MEVPPDAALDLRTSNGVVTTSGISGPIDARTSNGAVRLAGPEFGASVRTSNGDVSFDGTFSDSPQRVQTTNDPITLRLPASTGFTIDARTTNAEVVLDGFTLQTTAPATEVAKQGIVGAGGPWIVLRTSNAAIVISAR